MSGKILLIGEIPYRDIRVKIYYDPKMESNESQAAWQARNPDSYYKGSMFLGADGKITYPEVAVIPEQTARDREHLPKFVVTGMSELDENYVGMLTGYLDKLYFKYNRA